MDYADGRTYAIPEGWPQASAEVLDVALRATLDALMEPEAIERLRRYYDPESAYSGLLFAEVGHNHDLEIGVDDLWAVSSLSIPVNARQGRLLLDQGSSRSNVHRQLQAIDATIAITDLDKAPLGSAATLDKMWDLHEALRSLLSTEERDSIHWVFAAKMCARKRPRLFPVRDTLVCQYLGGGQTLRTSRRRPGEFSTDMQVFAYLMTHQEVRDRLKAVRDGVTGVEVDRYDLRLLDAVLWTKAKWG